MAESTVRPVIDKPTPRTMQKGLQTRATILEAAVQLASLKGLEGLSMGSLAEVTRMSKSGVFSHFGSREELQISVVRVYHQRFAEEVFYPALQQPRGLPRLVVMFDRWVGRVAVEIDSGCLFISGAVEFDDRPGPVREALAATVMDWHNALERAILQSISEGHLRQETDANQLLFELHGFILALHHDARFLRKPHSVAHTQRAFDRLMSFHATPAGLKAMADVLRPPIPSLQSADRQTSQLPRPFNPGDST